jgi:redox-sensitive bicupin YhaK (pirin superfamily)
LAEEMAVYTASASVGLDGATLPEHELAVLGGETLLHAPQASRCMVVGGAALDGTRFLWWNFVASRRERLVQAAQDWREMHFGQVPGETEFIPLPDRAFPPAQAEGEEP